MTLSPIKIISSMSQQADHVASRMVLFYAGPAVPFVPTYFSFLGLGVDCRKGRPQTENEPLDVDASKTAFEQLAKEINTSNDREFIVG